MQEGIPPSGEQYFDPAQAFMMQQLFKENDIYNYLFAIVDLYAPDEIKKQLWVLIENTRFIATSNIREKDIFIYKRRISEQIDQIMESIPPYKLTYSFYIVLENIELLLHLAVDRAINGFERRAETTQIKHLIMSQEADGFAAAQPKRGIMRAFGKLFG
ncbi:MULTISPECIES: hypothetical protein [unclassified Archaeoglobus]|jgi:hypothetical protein|uniref:hypothetical protein n=1 Tax=unclassified Archaeoglobus TaxID=2643606 RepID=UPI0025B8AD60|nr:MULTISPECIES: hypothetical protein [unclassified Archaeoglobus]